MRLKNLQIKKNLPLLLMIIILSLPLPFIIGKSSKRSVFRHSNELVGVLPINMVQIKIPPWSISAFFSGDWQNKFSVWLDQQVPFRKNLIGLHNEIYFDLFHRSYMSGSSLVIGKNKYLYEMSYIVPYCNLNHQAYSQASFDQWAKQLETINQFFLRRGQKFIYVITPSKAAYDPQYLPGRIPCKDIRPNYIMAKATLKKAHIPYVDGSAITLNYRSQYGDLLFPRGGMHWTLLAASLTANELAKKISMVTGHYLPPITYSYTTSFTPQGWDLDLTALANLAFPNKNYLASQVSFKRHPGWPQGKRLTLAVVGGSFLAGILDAFNEMQLFSRMDYYFYFKAEHSYFVDGSFAKYGEKGVSLPFDPKDPQSYQNILNADVVILEENENLVSSSTQLKLFSDWLFNVTH